MTALYIIFGIIAFFVILLSVPFHVYAEYSNYLFLKVRFLFLKFNILPIEGKKEKKPKEKKEPNEKKPAKEKKPEKSGENPFMAIVKAKGFDGMMEIIGNLGRVLGNSFKKFGRAFVIEEFDIDIAVGKGDAAATAIEYGKVCGKVFPVCGAVCTNMKVKKYSVNVEPDFLANRNKGNFVFDFYIIPRKMINAFFVMVIQLIFKVVIKFFSGNKTDEKTNAKAKKDASDKDAA